MVGNLLRLAKIGARTAYQGRRLPRALDSASTAGSLAMRGGQAAGVVGKRIARVYENPVGNFAINTAAGIIPEIAIYNMMMGGMGAEQQQQQMDSGAQMQQQNQQALPSNQQQLTPQDAALLEQLQAEIQQEQLRSQTSQPRAQSQIELPSASGSLADLQQMAELAYGDQYLRSLRSY